MSTLPGQRSLKEGVTIKRSNDRNYVALNILLVTAKIVHLVSLSGLYLVAMGKCLRISNTRQKPKALMQAVMSVATLRAESPAIFLENSGRVKEESPSSS